MNIFRSLVKLLLFAAILVAGIVFVSDGFMARIDQGVKLLKDDVGGAWQKKEPAFATDFSAQTQETKTEIKNLSQNISASAWNNFKSWVWGKVSGVWQNFTK